MAVRGYPQSFTETSFPYPPQYLHHLDKKEGNLKVSSAKENPDVVWIIFGTMNMTTFLSENVSDFA